MFQMSPHIAVRDDKSSGHSQQWVGPRSMPQQQQQQQHPHSVSMDPTHLTRPSIVMGTGRPSHAMEVKVDQPDSTTLQVL